MDVPEDMKNTRAADVLRALAHPTRVDVIRLVSDREMSVNELVAAIGASQSSLSQHLAVLRGANLVHTRREAQTIRYSIASNDIIDFIDLVDKLANSDRKRKR